MEYRSSADKQNTITYVTLWMKLAKIMSSKRSQTQKRTFITQFHLYNVEKQAK